FLKLAEEGTVVPVVKRVMADLLTPVAAYLKIERLSPYSFLLESVEGGEKVARYSFLGFEPDTIVRSRARKVTIEADSSVEETDERLKRRKTRRADAKCATASVWPSHPREVCGPSSFR